MRNERRKKKENKVEKKCPFCGNNMKYKGPKDINGTVYWKCRGKSCGRTVNHRSPPPKNVVPLVYQTLINWGKR